MIIGYTMEANEIDVSVYMLTYYHEKYLRQAIESVLSQETHYKFELVISDDYSQDGTRAILEEYEKKYPDIIRVNYNDHNIGIPSNIFKARSMCRGRYITVLSGDDYWIRKDKLEIETKFLDEHEKYVALFNGIELRMDDSEMPYDKVPRDRTMLNREYTLEDYEKCVPLGTHGFFMRNYFLTEEGRDYFAQARQISEFVDDAVDEVLILRKGPVYLLDIYTDAHRVVNSNDGKKNYNSRYTKLEKFKHHIDLLNGMSARWSKEINFSNWYANYTAVGILSMLLTRQFKKYKEVFKTIPTEYKRFPANVYIKSIKYIFLFVVSRFKRGEARG